MEYQDVLESLIEECEDDHVGLWAILWPVEVEMGVKEPAAAARATTMRLVRALLVEHGMLAGFPTEDGRGFTPWNLSPDEVIRRIDEEWTALGREPDIGDIVWFTVPNRATPRAILETIPTPQPPAP